MPSGSRLTNAMIATRWTPALLTADSATFTTEVSLLSITGTVTNGARYSIRATIRIGYSSGTLGATDTAQMRIREDNSAGNQLQMSQNHIASTTGNGFTMAIEADFTASSTGSKTFHLTAQRVSAAAVLIARASSAAPAILTVQLHPV